MTTKTIVSLALVASALAGGCSTTDGDQPAAKPSSATSSAAAAMTLKDICPQVEAALPAGTYPSAAKLQRFAVQIAHLSAGGDHEAQTALALLGHPTDVYLRAERAKDPSVFDAHQGWLDGLDALARRCKAAGSTALQ